MKRNASGLIFRIGCLTFRIDGLIFRIGVLIFGIGVLIFGIGGSIFRIKKYNYFNRRNWFWKDIKNTTDSIFS